ncbi:hypothetical protein EGH82_13280 [Vibrio ponticus]|uniref:Haem-binding uptake Tiki superfamily ChaN domain-containing protein n=1 Tax=Vibrio ponticus TaxID=265668 RepID=A0A3N3DYB3_9VIBR|nr:ChaN family lipoprotein [Vibrio ponticus]ROV59524.1 hypothetical protein EGH82_13280 [Vibrio ponticus]
MLKNLLPILIALPLLGCANTSLNSSEHTPIASFYDYQLYSPGAQSISLEQFTTKVKSADVILVGEWHTHSAIHRFQTNLLKQLVQGETKIALSMEQFTRDKQSIIDQYLAGEIGEQPLIKQGNAWPNYESDYRPLIEFAKTNQVDVIAANAPRAIVRCIGRVGKTYVEKLPSEQKKWVAAEINTDQSPYKAKFMQSMHHGETEQSEKHFAAQMAWDETMAESIVNYLAENPTHQVMHIAGKFHIEGGLGTKASILRRNPNLNVIVVTPVSELTPDSDDYLLNVLPPPLRYVQQENRIKAIQAMGHSRKPISCD